MLLTLLNPSTHPDPKHLIMLTIVSTSRTPITPYCNLTPAVFNFFAC